MGEQLICQIEMYAVVCVRWKVRYLLYKRRFLLFIDNEPCRFSLVRAGRLQTHSSGCHKLALAKKRPCLATFAMRE